MTTKHTAGTWHAHDGQIYPVETGKTIAVIPYFDKDNEEQDANVKLMAAAPELAKALERIIDRIEENNLQDSFPMAFSKAKEALNRIS